MDTSRGSIWRKCDFHVHTIKVSAEILVPYIKRAKKLRQIIMVTHNPNLAIVADAEQIIYMNIDKENNYVVSCYSGGIEDRVMNNHIVDILEGKMKYQLRARLRKTLKAAYRGRTAIISPVTRACARLMARTIITSSSMRWIAKFH